MALLNGLVAPPKKPSLKAVALLASDCTDSNTLDELLASVVVIVASTLTLAAVTVRVITSGATPTEAARPAAEARRNLTEAELEAMISDVLLAIFGDLRNLDFCDTSRAKT